MALPYTVSNMRKAEETARSLGEAINTGDKAEAIRCVEQLLTLNVPVCMQLSPEAYSQECIRLRVGVEDVLSDAYITMLVTPGMTISELKQKSGNLSLWISDRGLVFLSVKGFENAFDFADSVTFTKIASAQGFIIGFRMESSVNALKESEISRDYGFHPSLQCWIIGKRFAKDGDTLFSHNVTCDDDQAFLFIRSAHSANLSREQQKQEEQDRKIGGIIENIEMLSRGPEELGARHKQPQVSPVQKPDPKPLPTPVIGWSCAQCTYMNKPTRPGCAMCSAARPENYKIPDIYQPDEEETRRLQQEELASLQYEQSIIAEREKNFLSLLETDNLDLVSNTEEICCPICYEQVPAGDGATLRECLHSFCRECVKMTILNCVDAEVACPFTDGEYNCDCTLQDREIKTLLSPDEYQKFLELRLNIAESRSENSYHCKTPDCPGWCIFEDDVNEFACDICNETNCLLCKAIHKGMNCKEYQDDLRIRAENDAAAKRTTEILELMLQNGEAMYCPKCKVIIQKKDGCDWICCLMCKTEICWVTKQARWGPQGPGDVSGGCKCRINGAPCHPNCQNCH